MPEITGLVTTRNESLFQAVNAIYKVKLVPSTTGIWSSQLIGNTAEVGYVDTGYPEACFAHELLHFQCILKGFKKPKYGVSALDTQGHLSILMEAFDNELQHHKMYDHFLSMGYRPAEFYNDKDMNETPKFIRAFLSAPERHYFGILPSYLTVISPGSELIFADIEQLKLQFRQIRSTPYLKDLLDHTDKQISIWRASSSYNPSSIISSILGHVPGAQYTYVGFDDVSKFPKDGFFVGPPFKIRLGSNGTCQIIP